MCQFLLCHVKQGLKVLDRYQPMLIESLESRDAPEALRSKINGELVSSSPGRQSMTRDNITLQQLINASQEELEHWLENAKSNGQSTVKLEKWLLHKYCDEGVSAMLNCDDY